MIETISHELSRNAIAYAALAAVVALVVPILKAPRELRKTLAFVAVALLLMGAASWQLPGRGHGIFDDQGKKFFPGLVDPLTVKAMEVVGYDPTTSAPAAFEVKQRADGRWVIPSHHDYPADAKDRLAKTAGGVFDLVKDTIRSDQVEDHETFGVLDPKKAKSANPDAFGKRVTLRDKSGEILADLIIGKEVAGQPGQRYVRIPDKNRTYGVNVKVDLSTRFADWIETNLLKLDASRVRRLVFDNHKVDPEEGVLRKGEVLTVERKDASGPWTLDGLAPDQEVDAEKLTTLTTALADLKIVGVRPKPDGLTSELKAADAKGISLTQDIIRSLARKGFYLLRDGRFLSNQGDLIVETDQGIVYTLRFGEVTFETGDALSAGASDSAASPGEKEAAKKADGSTASRYLFVTVIFDPDLIPKPASNPPGAPVKLPKDVFYHPPGDPKRVAQDKEAQDKADREKADRDRLIAEGQKLAKDLTDRFAAWYYVVPGDNARNILLDRAALSRKKGERPAPRPGLGLDDEMGPGPGGAMPFRLPPGHP